MKLIIALLSFINGAENVVSFKDITRNYPTVNYGKTEFNLESSQFSRIETIKTWLADKHQKDQEKLQLVQFHVGGNVIENNYSEQFRIQIPQKDSNNIYGHAFSTISPIELSFLQEVSKLSKIKEPVVLELAAGIGLVSWKVPLCFQDKGKFYVNDLSETALNTFFNEVTSNNLRNFKDVPTITKIPGDCLKLETRPELLGKVDVIYAQCLEHFFNPEQHQAFLKLLDKLLVPGGKAFLSALSFPFGLDNNHSAFKVYNYRKESSDNLEKTYCGFINHKTSYLLKDGKWIQKESETFNVPKNAELFVRRTKTDTPGIDHVEMSRLRNYFSPAIYKNAIDLARVNLKITDSFFIDSRNETKSTWASQTKDVPILFSSCIAEKNLIKQIITDAVI